MAVPVVANSASKGTRAKSLPLIIAILVGVVAVSLFFFKKTKSGDSGTAVAVEASDAEAKEAVVSNAPANVPETDEAAAPAMVAEQPVAVEQEAAQEVKPRRQAGIRVLDKDGNDVFKPRPELKTNTDKFLFSVLHRPVGAGKTVLRVYKLDEDFKKSLEAPIEILETDTDEERAIKMEIEGVKQELAEHVKNGERIEDLLEDIRNEVNQAAEEHAAARRELYSLIKAGKFDEAEMLLDETNKKFAENGILELHIPDKLLKKAITEHADEYDAYVERAENAENSSGVAE